MDNRKHDHRSTREAYQAAARKLKRSRKARSLLALASVFVMLVTSLSLMNQADTMEWEAVACALEEHVHTEDCYAWVTDHEETEDITAEVRTLTCTFQPHVHTALCASGGVDTACGLDTRVYHTHDALCYDADGTLVCNLLELREHTHTDACYETVRTLVCGQEESDGHTHTEDCYETQKILTCDYALVHKHTEDCIQNGVYVCGYVEIKKHQHTEECFTVETIVLEKGHHHTDRCYVKTLVCGKQEHVHSEACLVAQPDAGEPLLDGTQQAGKDADEEQIEDSEPSETALPTYDSISDTEFTENDQDELNTVGQVEEGLDQESQAQTEPGVTAENGIEDPDEPGDEDGTGLPVAENLEAGEKATAGERQETATPGPATDSEDVPSPLTEEGRKGPDTGSEAEEAQNTEPQAQAEPDGTLEEDSTEPGVLDDDEDEYLSFVDIMDAIEEVVAEVWEEITSLDPVMDLEDVLSSLQVDEEAVEGATDATAVEDVSTPSDLRDGDSETEGLKAPEESTDAAQAEAQTEVQAMPPEEALEAPSAEYAEDPATASDLDAVPELEEVLTEIDDDEITDEEYELLLSTPTDLPEDGTGAPIRVLELGLASIQAIGDELPEGASGSAVMLDGSEAAEAASLVEAFRTRASGLVMRARNRASSSRVSSVQYKVLDISLHDVEQSAYAQGFQVDVRLPEAIIGSDFRLFHIHDGEVSEITAPDLQLDERKITDDVSSVSGFTFVTENFSQFVLSYTVDFEYVRDGQTYQFSLEGDGIIRLSELFEVLQVTYVLRDDQAAGDGTETMAQTSLHGASVIQAVDYPTFSDETLLRLYPDEESFDWVLESLRPFDTDELLTVHMRDGGEIVISVKDEQIRRTYISASGEAYEITVTYDAEAEIPDGATLEVREILPGDEDYDAYYAQSMNQLGVDGAAHTEAADAAANDGHGNADAAFSSAADDPADEADTTAAESIAYNTQDASASTGNPSDTYAQAGQVQAEYARIFDIEIWYEGEKIEPKAPVTVEMKLLDAPEDAAALPQVVHFADTGVETLHITSTGTNTDTHGITFETDSFSVYAVVYTVDFHWEANGHTFDFSIPGGGQIALSELAETLGLIQNTDSEEHAAYDSVEDFLEAVADVEFSDESLVQVTKNEEDLDWTLISLQPFDTEETLTITMKNGDVITVKVTDAQIRKTVISATGETFEITVTYDDDAEIPEGAELEARELEGEEYEDYLGRTAVKLNASGFAYARVFDISIIDMEGENVQPLTPVQVEISLLDSPETSEDFAVIHFEGEEEEPEEILSETEGNIISFATEGFSAYAIVKGPEEMPIGWKKVSSLTELVSLGSSGFYVGHPDGYYLAKEVYTISGTRTGIKKIKPATTFPKDNAVKYYFQADDSSPNQFTIYCYDGEEKRYVKQSANSLTLTTEEDASVFTIDTFPNTVNTFRILGSDGYYWNMQGGAGGNGFAAYNSATDGNAKMVLWYFEESGSDPYGMDGKTFGLMNWTGGVAGKAMMASTSDGRAAALDLTVMSKSGNNADKLFVPDNSDISMWTFHWIDGDTYYLTTTVEGTTRYLRVSREGLSLVAEQDEACSLQLVPGSGTHAGEICLKGKDATLTYSGNLATGFTVGGSAGSEWLKLVEVSELTSDYFMPYSARKVGVSDEDITNGSRVIVYTRVWDDNLKKYLFYAIDSDGSLVPCYESGDDILWVGSKLNTLLWNFVEYYWEDTGEPNYYYELYNQYSTNFIAPQASGGQILSDGTIGINLNGRRDGQYYSTILAWDEDYYAYAGLKADVATGKIVSCSMSEADDFYFAVMEEPNINDNLTTVETVDHTQYGITMKIVNFGTKTNNGYNEADTFFGSNAGGAVQYTQPNLLSTNLGEDGYPMNRNGVSMSTLYGSSAEEVNHLFIQSTYNASGYYEYDSTQNFATLNQSTGNFKVYQELGTMDGDNKNSLKHGQFMPFNDLEAGVFASVNPKNLYNATLASLPNSDPRKNEQMYLVRQPDYYFGLELEASFTQPPNGLDDWGHDIIYEFTGDDDFWLYVDGELIIDLGGIHSALAGSVNYSTGQVKVNGTVYTLRELFASNYMTRNPDASKEELEEFLGQYFDEGSTIFKDYSSHTMRIFYMERGAGASNLHMRFNLASIKPGTVQLGKTLSGVDSTESVLAEFPYQVIYHLEGDEEEHYLTNLIRDDPIHNTDYVLYKDTVTPVKFQKEFKLGDLKYENVFFLKPGEICDIAFPQGMTDYKIVECGLNTEVYDSVSVNGIEISGNLSVNADGERVEGRKDYEIPFETTDNRARVSYVNHVNPEALRTLTITKKLYREDGSTELGYTEDNTSFNFRLYLAAEFDELTAANMHTYHVLDPDGNYCRWDVEQQKFISLGDGKNEYTALTEAEKTSATFHTSMNGAISKIAAGYTVEVRDILAGTKFKAEERTTEIPDGYSFQKYRYQGEDCKDGEEFIPASEGVTDTIHADKDSKVEICNLRGWGLRVNKVWSDADYMAERDPVYFAVFTEDETENHNLTLVQDTLRQMPYGITTEYWYWLQLPVANVTDFDRYVIREVKLGSPIVDDNGVVTDWDDMTVIPAEGEVTLLGRQKDETIRGSFDYTVLYEKGKPLHDSHVRVDMVTNNRPGIELIKKDFDGHPLSGATFQLSEQGGSLIGTFTSDETGRITVAFLSDDKEYVLTEIKAPQGYHGLEAPLIMKLSHGNVTVTEEKSLNDYYAIDNQEKTPVLVIKNRTYNLKAIKKDGDTEKSLSGVHFELHKEVQIDNVVQIDVNPLVGYEDLVTDREGIIPQINQTLSAGKYELREKKPPAGYEELSSHIVFTISPTGEITLDTHPQAVTLSGETGTNGTLEYVLTIPNYQHKSFTFSKIWRNSTSETKIAWPDEKSITVNILQAVSESDTNPSVYATYIISQSDLKPNTEITADNGANLPKLKVVSTSENTYTFGLTDLPAAGLDSGSYIYYVAEAEQVDGFQSAKYFRGTAQAMKAERIEDGGTIANDQMGYELPSTGGPGTRLIYLLGSILGMAASCMLALKRRHRM